MRCNASAWMLGLVLLCLPGCAGYQLGPTNQRAAGETSIQVRLFTNQTEEPRLTEAVATALRRQLQQDGTYRLVTRQAGDIIVTGALVRYERASLSFQPRDILTVRDMELVLHARVLAVDRARGETLLDQEVAGRTTLRLGPDLSSAERQAAPLLAEELARNIAALLVDGTW